MPTLEEVFLRLGEEAEAESVNTLKSLIILDILESRYFDQSLFTNLLIFFAGK